MSSALAAALWLATASPERSCATVDKSVDAAIARKARELRADENCEHRIYLRADVDKDGTDDVLALFTLEPRQGAATAVYFLVVFPSGGSRTAVMTQVGARGMRIPFALGAHPDGAILIGSNEYGASDKICCPSNRIRLVFKLKSGELVPYGSVGLQPDTPDDGSLSKEQISRVVRTHFAGVKYCYEKELQKKAGLSGDVAIQWTIKPDGHVENARVTDATLPDDAVQKCILSQVGQWEFPKAPKPTPVSRYPFVFKVGDEKR